MPYTYGGWVSENSEAWIKHRINHPDIYQCSKCKDIITGKIYTSPSYKRLDIGCYQIFLDCVEQKEDREQTEKILAGREKLTAKKLRQIRAYK